MVDIDNIKNIAVIGGGVMGSGIAQVALLSGFEKVTVIDLSPEILKKSRELIQSRIKALESEEKCKELFASNEILKNLDFKEKLENFESVGIVANKVDTETIMSRLYTETEISKGVMDADFVIEAVTEKLELKQKIFKQLGEFTPPHAILASNTSSMSITKIAQDAKRPEKVIGLHFHTFFPITGMLIEITPGEKSSEESLEIGRIIAQNFPCIRGERFTVRLEKEITGLIGNRISLPMFMYFDWLIDNATDNGFALEQLGIIQMMFELLDSIGVDTAYNILRYFEKYVSSDFTPGKYITKLMNSGRFGKKVGKGFFDWNEDGTIKNPPSIDMNASKFVGENLSEGIIQAIQFNEACRVLEEGAVKSYKVIDKVLFKGNNSPGLFITGVDKYKEWIPLLNNIAEKTGKSYFKPCEMMESGKFLTLR
ncbi:MAG: 3-hydroxyacyl-CoA dehydrogenase family protein [Candidatus Lokiarchaeota archaeon]|nr:3-hydroxyacyl-CoA dehydrogenase family protein [Candidatus Lokiarchaeota archaeon]